MDFNYRPTSPLLSSAQIEAERQALTSGRQRNALMQLQVQQAQAAAQDQVRRNALMQEFQQSLPSPQMLASQQALMGGGGPTTANAARMPAVDPRLAIMHRGMKAGAVSPLDYANAAFPAPEAPKTLVAGGNVIQVRGNKATPLYEADRAPKLPEGMRVGADGQPEWIPGYLEGRGRVAASGASNISFGAPLPAINPKTGQPEFVRPDNKGGMTFTGVQPPPQNRDTKLPAELQRMQIAGDAMSSLMNDYEAMLKANNPRDPAVQMNPTVKADMQALKRNIELQFKELQALGALAGPDIEIIRQSLSDPFTFAGAYYGRDGLLAQVRRARDLVRVRNEAVLKQQPSAQPPAAAASSAPAAPPASAAAGPFTDAEKERRYQEWKLKQGAK